MKLRYPTWALRLSLNAYGWNRRLEMCGGLAGPNLNVPTGICAGSAHATYELKLYLLDYLCDAASKFKRLRVSIHVDDFALTIRAKSEELVLERLDEAASHMNVALERMQMKQAQDRKFWPPRMIWLKEPPGFLRSTMGMFPTGLSVGG